MEKAPSGAAEEKSSSRRLTPSAEMPWCRRSDGRPNVEGALWSRMARTPSSPSAESPSRTAAPSATPSTIACTTMPAIALLLFADESLTSATASHSLPDAAAAAGTTLWLCPCKPPLRRSAGAVG